MTMEELRSILMLFLMMLPAVIIGFVAGVLLMRSNYLPRILWYQRQINKLNRGLTKFDAPTPWVE